jgi:hypothetical protein
MTKTMSGRAAGRKGLKATKTTAPIADQTAQNAMITRTLGRAAARTK